MIASELGAVDANLGSKVELSAISADERLQKAQFGLELVSIYEALAEKFSVDGAVELITDSIGMFLDHHKEA